MLFSSLFFIFIFLPVVLVLYFISGNIKYKNVLLLIASLVFYSWGNVGLGIAMMSVIVVDYYCAILIEDGKRKLGIGIALSSNLGLLAYFKYTDFAFENYNLLIKSLGLSSGYLAELPHIALPIGISFYVFQTLSYVIDVYRNEVRANQSFLEVATFVTMFPQLVAGPIIKYHDVSKQLRERHVTQYEFATGVVRFIIGLSKKVLLANTFAFIADTIFGYEITRLGSPTAWLGIIAYALQIYYDFSGYSCMAFGLGKMLGFDFMENFNYPYIAVSVREFWRRWHISLSSWFRDYLYIPLGGSRKSEARTYFNLLIVFFATGIWHGAGWNFVVWGLWHGVFIMAERLFLDKILVRLPRFVGHLYLLLVVLIGWVFFRCENLTSAVEYLKTMFSFNNGCFSISDLYEVFITREILVYTVIAVVFAMPTYHWAFQFVEKHTNEWVQSKVVFPLFCLILGFAFLLCTSYLVSDTYNPFIYFRF